MLHVFEMKGVNKNLIASVSQGATATPDVEVPLKPIVTHVATPDAVKGIYMSSWVGGVQKLRNHIIELVDSSEVNSIVIDIKDATGKVAFTTDDASLNAVGCIENRIPDIKDFIKELHEKNIYVIGRVSTFQDPCFVAKHPELAVKTQDGLRVWKDRKGISWIDAGAKEAWDYNVQIAKASHDIGFDEINFDYIRFPSDGNMKDISFPYSGTKSKPLVIREFFQYLDAELHSQPIIASTVGTTTPQKADPRKDDKGNLIENITISADLFGMVTTNKDDLGIGQVLENALPYVDFVSPMVYPSHFPATWNGIPNPAAKPYDVIHISMKRAAERATAMGIDVHKLRPWLQEFNLGAVYTADMIRAQMQATYDVGLNSWLIWNPSNKYNASAYLPN
jgi:hypothetical protein